MNKNHDHARTRTEHEEFELWIGRLRGLLNEAAEQWLNSCEELRRCFFVSIPGTEIAEPFEVHQGIMTLREWLDVEIWNLLQDLEENLTSRDCYIAPKAQEPFVSSHDVSTPAKRAKRTSGSATRVRRPARTGAT